MSSILCPVCKQDLRAKPHDGWRGDDCRRCGQGLQWRFAAKIKRLTKRAADRRKAAAQKRSVNKNLVGGRAVR